MVLIFLNSMENALALHHFFKLLTSTIRRFPPPTCLFLGAKVRNIGYPININIYIYIYNVRMHDVLPCGALILNLVFFFLPLFVKFLLLLKISHLLIFTVISLISQ